MADYMLSRRGFTLVEVLVVLGIIGLLAAILIPAVMHARESARRATCQNQMRQIGLAIQNHESSFRRLPGLYNGTFLKQPRNAVDEFHFHSWRTELLPELDQSPLHRQIDFDEAATSAANATNLTARIATFICPSTSIKNDVVPEIYEFRLDEGTNPVATGHTAARSDYEAIAGVNFPTTARASSADLSDIKFGAWGEPQYDLTNGRSLTYRVARFRDVTDGLSNTMLIAERAGRPDRYRRGASPDPYPYADPNYGMDHLQAAWGVSTHIWWLFLMNDQGINVDNARGLYSFHGGGANVGLGDGSVRFLSDDIEKGTLNALGTRSGRDTVKLGE